MKTAIGNWENHFVTTINCDKNDTITRRQWANACKRMRVSPSAEPRFVPVAGAKIEHIEIIEKRPK